MIVKDRILDRVENKDLNEDGSFVVPNGITSIGYHAFCRCRRLTSVTIPDSVTSIGYGAFRTCSSLTSITIPNSVTSIGAHAFAYCDKSTSVTIGNSVTSIGLYAFFGCSGLKSKKSIYKAFEITKNGKLKCIDKIYTPGKWNTVRGDLELYVNGIHYCTNLFEIFDNYYGKLDDEIAIYECKVKGEDIADTCKGSSLHCCRKIKPIKRLSREEIINILNGKEEKDNVQT